MIAKIKVLVADDDDNLRELILDTLEGEGYKVVTARDGREALEKVYSESPDIMILDVNMPYMTGFEVCEKIRNDVLMSNLPIIMLTVMGAEKDEIKGLKAGVNDYLTKPFMPSILIARIRSVLQRVNQGVSVNPLTYLPGNISIMKVLEEKLRSRQLFGVLYVDLDNFKAFNDYYGFQAGDEVIKETARIIISAVGGQSSEENFVGHIGGDDFIAVIHESRIESVSTEIIKKFDSMIKRFYDEEDRKRGYIVTENRRGEREEYPIMTVSIGAVTSRIKQFSHVGEISKLGSELKKFAKKHEKSCFVIDRRSGKR